MKEDRIRVLRVLEYEGPRSHLELTLRNSIQGERWFGASVIRAATLGITPEILAPIPTPDEIMMELLCRTR